MLCICLDFCASNCSEIRPPPDAHQKFFACRSTHLHTCEELQKCRCEVVPSSTFPNSFSLQDTFPTMVNNEHVHRSQPILTGFRAGGLGTVSSDPLVLNGQLHPHASWNPGPILSCAFDHVSQHRSFGIIVTD